MSYRGLPELPEFYEAERPRVTEQILLVTEQPDGQPAIVLEFSDSASRAYWKRWLESKAGYEAFGMWVDGRP